MILFEIINDKTGTEKKGNYYWKVLINFNVIAEGEVKNFPRQKLNARDLVRLALEEWEKQQ